MAFMPDENIFRLSWVESGITQTLDTTPTNWSDMSMGLSRDLFSIKRDTTTKLTFIGEAATVITSCFNLGTSLTLTLYRRANDWTMTRIRAWNADFLTYEMDGSKVSVSFASSTARKEIEKNKSTKYEIDFPTYTVVTDGITTINQNYLLYDGIDHDSTNIVSGVVKTIDKYDTVRNFSPSNWILPGNHSTSEYAPFTYNYFNVTATESRSVSLRVMIGRVEIQFSDDLNINSRILLGHYRGDNLVGNPLYSFDKRQFFIANSSIVIEETAWKTFTVSMLAGDDIRLFLNTAGRPDSIKVLSAPDLRLEIVSQETSAYQDYDIPIITVSDAITALLSKMCTVPPALTYSLPVTPYMPVFSSGQGLTQTDGAKITLSFEDVMKCLLCLYGADYEILDGAGDDSTLVVDDSSYFYSSTDNGSITAVEGIKTKVIDAEIYGTVAVGFAGDDNSENGMYDPLCRNVFKLSQTGGELDLVCPFKGSPTTIESFITSKKASSSKTDSKDDSVFVFCVVPIVDYRTTLYRSHTITYTPTPNVVNANYFNVPFSPMRMLIANGAYLKVSKWNDTSYITFVSTNRTNLMASYLDTETYIVREYDGESIALGLSMTTPLYLPVSIDMSCFMDLWTKANIDAFPRGYFTVTDEKSENIYTFYINDVSLPLTKRTTTDFSGMVKTIA